MITTKKSLKTLMSNFNQSVLELGLACKLGNEDKRLSLCVLWINENNISNTVKKY